MTESGHNGHNKSATDELRERSEELVAEGDARGEDGDFRGALSDYKKAARLEPQSPSRLLKLAEGYAANDLNEKALETFGRALEASRDTGEEAPPDAYVGLGDLCRTVANSAAAVRSYERAVRARPKKPFYRWKLAVALAALGLV
jgi:tetratricopeptide (TPR) repeat protein